MFVHVQVHNGMTTHIHTNEMVKVAYLQRLKPQNNFPCTVYVSTNNNEALTLKCTLIAITTIRHI